MSFGGARWSLGGPGWSPGADRGLPGGFKAQNECVRKLRICCFLPPGSKRGWFEGFLPP